ncbi:hypothetical protein [Eubacterium sp. AB3007]|uniref:hypothetical protein n=1 Tax=Eubacterium sp. AB3007 TaxID=1392487 RepID=UPI00047F3A60|nr:hypothetical protein [Eubacterium sp. AB3007]
MRLEDIHAAYPYFKKHFEHITSIDKRKQKQHRFATTCADPIDKGLCLLITSEQGRESSFLKKEHKWLELVAKENDYDRVNLITSFKRLPEKIGKAQLIITDRLLPAYFIKREG